MYHERHKVLLQALIQEGYLHDNDCKELVIKLFDHGRVMEVINVINDQLKQIDMNIKALTCEVSGETYWVFVARIGREISNFQVEFSTTQLDLMKKIFHELITSTNGFISSTACINLCTSSDTKMSISETVKFLDQIVEAKWLYLKDGQYYIGVRSIAELLPYFQDAEESIIQKCSLCKESIFFGKTCTQCNNKVHVFCLRKYATVRGSSQCHICNNPIEVNDSPINPALEDMETQSD